MIVSYYVIIFGSIKISKGNQLKDNLSFEVPPVKIEDRRVKLLRGKQILLVKVIWNQTTGDATWELEDKMREQYPELFS